MNRNQRSDPEELKTMMTFFLTMPWVPIVYYGEEIGMRSMDGVPAVEGSRDRSAERTPMQWGDGPTAGFSTCTPEKLYLPIDPSPTRPTVENEINDAGSMYSWTKGLLALRASIPALGNTGDWKYASNPNQPYPAVYERSANGEKYLVVINPRAEKAKCTITGYDGMESVVWGAPENISMKSSGQGLVITIKGVSSVICKMK
jgi:maltose alpha-D-glucosyltransferase/alpha-amylase